MQRSGLPAVHLAGDRLVYNVLYLVYVQLKYFSKPLSELYTGSGPVECCVVCFAYLLMAHPKVRVNVKRKKNQVRQNGLRIPTSRLMRESRSAIVGNSRNRSPVAEIGGIASP